jgi:alkylation response protein AidB-like acyl-CoA dehydrogenase
MDFRTVDPLAGHRDEARAWVEENVDPSWAGMQRATGTHHSPALMERLAAAGILGAGWPAAYGGTDVAPALARCVFEEIAGFGVHLDGWSTTQMVARTLLEVGTEEQKQEFVRGALEARITIALGYSEPDTGSDVAAASTRAVRDGDTWTINGTKMFTSTADASTHVFLLARTNPDVPKHRGLTMFLVDVSKAGFECRAIFTLGGQRTNATFYNDMTVPDAHRVGEVDGGWAVMRVALVHERGLSGGVAGPTLADRFVAWCREAPRPGSTLEWADPRVRESMARIAMETEVARLLRARVGSVTDAGGTPALEGSMAKLFATEAAQRHFSVLLDLVGPESVLQNEADAPLGAAIEYGFRNAVVGTMRGGSSEIMREIIAERRLGLPRARP